MIAPEDDNKVRPSLGEYFACVPVEYDASFGDNRLELIQYLEQTVKIKRDVHADKGHVAYLVLIYSVALPFFVVLLIKTLLLDEITDVYVLQGDRRFLGQELGVGRLAGARGAGYDNDGSLF